MLPNGPHFHPDGRRAQLSLRKPLDTHAHPAAILIHTGTVAHFSSVSRFCFNSGPTCAMVRP